MNNLKIFKKANRTVFVVLLLMLQAISCTGQNNTSTKSAKDKLDQQKQKQIDPKDLRALSLYTDTALINRFLPEIQAFIKNDSLNPDRKTDVLFVGSSSFRMWNTLADDMPGIRILNRGFGGSTIPEVIYFSDILIFRHNPQKIVLYAGENDIACKTCKPETVIGSFRYFHQVLKQNSPDALLYFVSLKPSPSRMVYWPHMQQINDEIKKYCSATKNCRFIDISDPMFGGNTKVRPDIFLSDSLHLNKEGYKIWAKTILSALKKQNK
jgi:lysophospholipase L1-like esterase